MESPSPGDWSSLTVADLQRVDRLCQEFEDAWRGNPPPAPEDYLGRAPDGAYKHLLGELLALDVEYRRKAGQSPTPDDYDRLSPDDTGLIRRLWPAPVEPSTAPEPVPLAEPRPPRLAVSSPPRVRPRRLRRDRLPAALATIAALVLLALAVIGPWVAWRERRRADSERQIAARALDAEARALDARDAEASARRRAEVDLAVMHAGRGRLASEQGDAAGALSWYAEAARIAAMAGDTRLRDDALREGRLACGRAVVPVGAFSLHGTPRAVAFRPGDVGVVLLRTDRAVVVWDWVADTVSPWPGAEPRVAAAAWSPDGALLAIGAETGEVQVRRVPDGAVVRRWEHPGPVTALAFGAGGRYLAVASDVVLVRDDRAGQLLPMDLPHPGAVLGMAFNPAGDRLATTCADGHARVFAIPGGPTPLFPPVVHEARDHAAPAFVRRGLGVATLTPPVAGHPAWLTIRDATTGAVLRSVDGTWTRAVASPDGRWLAACGPGAIRLWDTEGDDRDPIDLGQRGGLSNLAFSPDASVLLGVSPEGTARTWSLPGGAPAGPPILHTGGLKRSDVAGGSGYFVTAQADGLVRVWRRPVGHAEPELSDEGLALLGELANSRRLERGRTTAVGQDRWLRRWGQFHRANPRFGAPAEPQPRLRFRPGPS